MKLNNDYGKFNYAFCLYEHKKILSPPPNGDEDEMEIIHDLAKGGFVGAQRFCAFVPVLLVPYFGEFRVFSRFQVTKFFRDMLRWCMQASLQLDYFSIMPLGGLVNVLGYKNKQKREELSFELLNIASQSGYFNAQFELINRYKLGKGTQKNLKEAKNWCIKALDCNENEEDETAIEIIKSCVFTLYFELFNETFNEIHLCLEDQKAVKEFLEFTKVIRDTGRISPRYELLVHYLECITGEKKDKNAIEYLEESAKLDSGWAFYELGRNYFYGKHGVERDDKKAFFYFEKAVKELPYYGSTHYYLGIMYLIGRGVEKDEKKAIECLISATKHREKRAVERLEGLSQNTLDLKVICELGKIYLKGNCVLNDVNKAIEYFERAANQNHEEGFYQLGKVYTQTMYLKLDKKKALKYFEKAANKNHAKAFYQMGIMHIEKDTDHIKTDPKKAIECFERAADLNCEKALYELTKIYLYGKSGVEKDEEKAFQYLERVEDIPKKHRDDYHFKM